jgi:aryl-phospho-beta-D-glucosidase BglC (GH1 family)
LATIATAQATGTIINPALPIVTVADAQAQQGSGESFTASGIGTLLPAGFLSTSGNQIVDAAGTPVRINAINWFGMETSGGAPDGLWQVNYRSTMQQMVQLGFNAIRIPFSLQSLSPSSIPSNISASLNPDLAGLTSLQVLDRIVAEAGTLGLKIILDNHTASVGSSANPNGLWYDANFSSQTFTNDWVSLASHYAGNSTVIGFDLLNEPHGPASWGDGNPATDWQRQATITGDAIQAVNPNALILVEGVQTTAGISTAWGENLSGVASHPVVLATPDKLVYSAHDYPVSVTGNSYFNDPSYPANLPGIWTQDWGYIAQQGIAPVLIGEYGSKLATTTDQVWISSLVNYLNGSPTASTVSATPSGEQPYSWAYWDWNPNSGDTGGILKDDWTTVDQTKLAAITPAFWKPAADGPGEVDFALRLSQAATTDITLHVQTVDGTARQGVDYAPVSEDVVFKAGSTSAVVAVDLLQTSTGSAQSLFFLRLADPIGASLDTTDATGTILPAVATTTTTTPTTTPTTTTPATTTTTPDPTPSTTDAQPSVGPGVVRVDMQNDWGSGLVANVTVSNTGSTVSGAWQIELTTTEQITNLWNGTILSHIGSVYEIGNASYNGAIVAGGSTVFGFQASHVVAGEGLAAQIVRFS